jgi:hypothetical protein
LKFEGDEDWMKKFTEETGKETGVEKKKNLLVTKDEKKVGRRGIVIDWEESLKHDPTTGRWPKEER